MALDISRTALIPVPGHGTIRVIPKGGRNVSIDAPMSLTILVTKERAQRKKRKKRLTPPNESG